MTIKPQATGKNAPSLAGTKGRYACARKFIEENKVSIKHFRYTQYLPESRWVNQFGGMTVAFQQKGNFVRLATAVCSDDDNYNAKLGTVLAVERLANNHAIMVPFLGVTALDTVNNLFRHLFEDYSALEHGERFALHRDPLENRHLLHGQPNPLASAMADGAEQFEGDEEDAHANREASSESDVWEGYAKLLVTSLVSKLGGTPQEVVGGLKYLLEVADEQELVAALAGTPAETFAGSSAVLAAVRQTAVQLLTGGPDGPPRLALVLRTRVSAQEPAAQSEGDGFELFNPRAALGRSLADMVLKARVGASDQLGNLEKRIRTEGGLKQAFQAIPAGDLLSALRNTPHGAAAAAFLSKLQGPMRGDPGEARG